MSELGPGVVNSILVITPIILIVLIVVIILVVIIVVIVVVIVIVIVIVIAIVIILINTNRIHPVSVRRFPSFRTRPLENLSHYL